jgi:hypothetical protein
MFSCCIPVLKQSEIALKKDDAVLSPASAAVASFVSAELSVRVAAAAAAANDLLDAVDAAAAHVECLNASVKKALDSVAPKKGDFNEHNSIIYHSDGDVTPPLLDAEKLLDTLVHPQGKKREYAF